MYAHVACFDGPRSAELIAADDRAGKERILPAIEADEQMREELVALLVLRQPDGAELAITVCRTEAGLERGRTIITNSELLPGEDPALLPGPDRLATYQVVASRMWNGVPA
jgi:hypothetical protein